MGFAPATSYEDTIPFQSIAIGDLNGDGIPDLAATRPYRFSGDARNPVFIPLSAVYVLFGRGDGTFGGDTVYTAGSGTIDLAIADVDRNGHNDLLVANASSSSVSVFLSDDAGRLQPPASYPTLAYPSALVVADLDGDGILDIATISGNYDSPVGLMRGSGGGMFGPAETITSFASAKALAAADLDLDGHVDLVISATYANGATILRGLGGGSFAEAELYGTGENPGRVAIRDFNGDGQPEIAVPNTSSKSLSILRNRASAVSVPALVWLENVSATSSAVQISWRSETIAATRTRVERSSNGTLWTALGQPAQNGSDQLTFDDRSVSEGSSYQYRLVIDGTIVVSLTSVRVPVVQALALSIVPNPVGSQAHLAFHLVSAERGSLEIWNAAGRRVWSQEVGTLGAGEHTIAFPRESALRSGSYFLRLTQGSRSTSQRFTVLR
jgi:hypothetical protein